MTQKLIQRKLIHWQIGQKSEIIFSLMLAQDNIPRDLKIFHKKVMRCIQGLTKNNWKVICGHETKTIKLPGKKNIYKII